MIPQKKDVQPLWDALVETCRSTNNAMAQAAAAQANAQQAAELWNTASAWLKSAIDADLLDENDVEVLRLKAKISAARVEIAVREAEADRLTYEATNAVGERVDELEKAIGANCTLMSTDDEELDEDTPPPMNETLRLHVAHHTFRAVIPSVHALMQGLPSTYAESLAEFETWVSSFHAASAESLAAIREAFVEEKPALRPVN